MKNNRGDAGDLEEARDKNITSFIHSQAYDNLRAPRVRGRLKFNNGCRFTDVKITKEGIQTRGHLWVVHGMLTAEAFSPARRPRQSLSRSAVERRLRELAEKLNDLDEEWIADDILGFLDDNSHVRPEETFSQYWLNLMAENIVEAIDSGKELGIGHLVKGSTIDSTRGAIFILGDSDAKDLDDGKYFYVFTSFQPEDWSWKSEMDPNDLDRHVSMVVKWGGMSEGHLRLFTTNRWIYGMCFFRDQPRRYVLFPWPESLAGL
jgi:hypothetical protein